MVSERVGRLEFRVLGPLEVLRDGALLTLGGDRQRALLALLLVRANEVLSVDQLVEQLFGFERSDTAVNAVRVAIFRLRRTLDDGQVESVLLTRPGGYLLRVDPDQLDASRFEDYLREGRQLLLAGEVARARERLRDALGLWRDAPLADLRDLEAVQLEVRRLDELRLAAQIERIDADLALGAGDELVVELEALVARHPLHERLRAQLMLALYHAGRQADALGVYREGSAMMRHELGLEPGEALRELERSILEHDPRIARPARQRLLVAGNLPVPATPFLGRAQELAEIENLFDGGDVRLLTLTGVGGSGKTRLAIETARRRAARYRDGAWFVGFADIESASEIEVTICRTLIPGGRAESSSGQLLRDWLSEREALVVVDNLEQLIDGVDVFAALLAQAPRLSLLATSREPLWLTGEHRYEVPTMAEADAVALLNARAAALAPRAAVQPSAAAAMCARVDFLPLAIELVAARLTALAPEDLLARLEQRLGVLTAGPRDAARRQRTLRATIDWSFALLGEPDRDLFAALAVFAGSWALDAAERTCGATLDGIQRLVDRSLVHRDGARYSMLPTIREYALERLLANPALAEIRDAHAQWCAEFVAREVGGRVSHDLPEMTVQRLIRERENVRAALTWSAANGNGEMIARIAAPLPHFVWVDTVEEADEWIALALRQIGQLPAPLAGELLLCARGPAFQRGDMSRVVALSRRAADIFRSTGDVERTAAAMIQFDAVAWIEGDLQQARSAIEDAVAYARTHGATRTLPLALVNLAEVVAAQGLIQEARGLNEEAFRLADGIDPATCTLALINLAELANLDDDARTGGRLGSRAVALALDRNDEHLAVGGAMIVAWALADQGELARAGRLLGAALGYLERAGMLRQRTDRNCEEAVRTALRRLDKTTAADLLTEGRTMRLSDALADARAAFGDDPGG